MMMLRFDLATLLELDDTTAGVYLAWQRATLLESRHGCVTTIDVDERNPRRLRITRIAQYDSYDGQGCVPLERDLREVPSHVTLDDVVEIPFPIAALRPHLRQAEELAA